MDLMNIGSCTTATVTGGTLPNFIQKILCISRKDPIVVLGFKKNLSTHAVQTRLSHVLHFIKPLGDWHILNNRK